jgi:lambda family phage tail tape measure protein
MRNVKRRVADQEREEKNYAKKHAAIASFGSSMGALSEESKFVSKEATRTAEIDKVFQDHLITLGKAIGTHSQAYINAEQQATALKETYKANDIELLRSSNTVKDGMLAGYKEISKDIGTMSEAVADSFVTTFDTSADSLANFVTTGKFNFKSFATSVISDIGDIMAAQAASGLLGMGLNLAIGAASTYFGGGVNQSTTFSGGGTSTLPANTAYAADGAVWGGGFKAFASGASVVSEPTLGLVGEGKYNEAIVPLPDGKSIPVQMKNSGGGNLTIATTINVSSGAGGSDADKDSLANKMALAIKKHVKEILVQERQRYGGLLYSGA